MSFVVAGAATLLVLALGGSGGSPTRGLSSSPTDGPTPGVSGSLSPGALASPTVSPSPSQAVQPAPTPRTPFWTVFIASLSREAGGRPAAEDRAAEARAAGQAARVLRTNDYGSLRPGYWCVYVGRYRTFDTASRQAAHLRDLGYVGAYPRCVGTVAECE